MNERVWLTTTRPYRLTSFIEGTASSRKLRLLAVACCYRVRHRFEDPRLCRAVEVAERYADGFADDEDLDAAYSEATSVVPFGNEGSAVAVCCSRTRFHIHLVHAHAGAAARKESERKAQCDLVRDIFGNPFRPASFSPAWRTDTALTLVRQMYDSRDFGAMPILADTLQDAGCEDEHILNHCRDANQVHVRGCWVVDLVLGKE